jgi:hypothetical protein
LHVDYAQPAILKVEIKKTQKEEIAPSSGAISFVFRTLPVSPMLSGLYGIPQNVTIAMIELNTPV